MNKKFMFAPLTPLLKDTANPQSFANMPSLSLRFKLMSGLTSAKISTAEPNQPKARASLAHLQPDVLPAGFVYLGSEGMDPKGS